MPGSICPGTKLPSLGNLAYDKLEAARAEQCRSLSNVSFGLNPATRAVLNPVFLDHPTRVGMTGAMVHVSKIRPLHLLAESEVKVAEDLIFDRRSDDCDTLQRMLELFADRKASDATVKKRTATV